MCKSIHFTFKSSGAMLFIFWSFATSAGHDDKQTEASVFPPSTVKWQDGPPSLPRGAKLAVLEGDPTKSGPFVFPVKVPDGYRIRRTRIQRLNA